MTRLLVESPNGFQELIEIHVSGSYFDLSLVTWDERRDGPFPPALLSEVGGLIRSGSELIVNAAKKSAYLAAKAAAAAAESAKLAAKEAAMTRLREFDDDTATPAQQKQFRKDIQLLLRHLLG